MQKDEHVPAWLIPVCFLFYLAVNMVSWRFPFFWDTLLTSTITTWFYENGWNGGVPPEHMDAGHPPLFYGYLLAWWKITDRSLVFSHLAMLPFLWTAVYQFIRIAERLLADARAVTAAAVLFCLETTILAQSTMVSADIVLLCFYLFGLRYLLEGRRGAVAIAAVVLIGLNLRGAFAAAALAATDVALHFRRKRTVRRIWKYAPAALLFIAWNAWHWHKSGWMLFTPSEQWDTHRSLADVPGMLHNIAAIVRIHLEPGRLLLMVFAGIVVVRHILLPSRLNVRRALLIALVPLAVFSLLFIPLTNPVGHRYFMVVYALAIILFIAGTREWNFRYAAASAVAAVMISGHFWVYPAPVSNGWDSSLAHTAWFPASRHLGHFLEQHGIPKDSVATHFPADVSGDQARLNGDTARPAGFESQGRPYVLYSNISNDFTEADIDSLETSCREVYHNRHRQVFVRLFECAPSR